MDYQKLWGCGAISSTAILKFLKNFLDFKLDMIEKEGIINFSCYSS